MLTTTVLKEKKCMIIFTHCIWPLIQTDTMCIVETIVI